MVSCDSACDLSQEMRERYAIQITHMYIHQDGKVYRDGVDICPDDIYATYAEKNVLPSTSAIPPEEYLEFFKSYTDKGYAVVHIGLSSGISSTCQDALLAAAELSDVYVIDSQALSCSGGLLAIEACRMRDEGMSAQEIYEAISGLVGRTNTSFIVAKLTYLAKGGRCSTATALGANILGIKPAVEMAEGTLSVGKKYRGKTADCFEKFLQDKLALAKAESDGGIACVYHAGIDQALFDHLVQLTRDSGIFQEVLTARAGSVISSHCGPETIGFTFQKRAK
jgi:DegV family protein with EDD domain